MNRQDRDQNNYGRDYDRYEGYSRDDDQYHSARNLTNEFEQRYRREHGYQDDNRGQSRIQRSFHEGDMDDSYNQRQRNGRDHQGYFGDQRNDRDRSQNYSGSYSGDRDRYRSNRDEYRSGRDMYNSGRNQNYGNVEQGYGISNYEGTSDRYNTLNSPNRSNSGDDEYYSSSRDRSGSSRFSDGMGDSFPGSNRGIPDTTYGKRDFSDRYGAGMGSTYGSRNYGSGSTNTSGERGSSFGSSVYEGSAGNMGGYGSMGSNSFSSRRNSFNSDREDY